MIEAPQSFVVREECDKAAWKHGFRRPLGERDGWAAYGSTSAQGTIWLAAAGMQGPWLLALDHPGIEAELNIVPAGIPGPGRVRYAFNTPGALYAVMPRLYQLAASLPDAPLQAFQAKVAGMPRTTEAERLVVQRIGQKVFRAGLMEYWQTGCPLTGITDAALLRASHIVPWAACASDLERLDVHNGFLLSALWDAAFDRGLVSFDDAGEPLFSPRLSATARAELRWNQPIQLTNAHRSNLARHRTEVFDKPSDRLPDRLFT